jgi:alpha,alpha-trehalase
MIPSALEHVQEIAGRGRHLAVFLDYDGTLTPIVGRPEQAILPDSTRAVLRALATKAPVAILSGRDLENVRRHVDLDGIVYAGSHGFDIAGPHGLRKQIATEFVPVLDAAEKELRAKFADVPGALVERKRFSIAAHYRQVADENVLRVEWAVNEVIANHRELRSMVGKKVYELQPNIDWNKGKAVAWILETMGATQTELCPLYIGDDRTDEDAFRALEKLGIGILVGEQPQVTAASYWLNNPEEVEEFLQKITDRLQGQKV